MNLASSLYVELDMNVFSYNAKPNQYHGSSSLKKHFKNRTIVQN